MILTGVSPGRRPFSTASCSESILDPLVHDLLVPVDALRVDLEQTVDGVAGTIDLGRVHARVEPEAYARVPQVVRTAGKRRVDLVIPRPVPAWTAVERSEGGAAGGRRPQAGGTMTISVRRRLMAPVAAIGVAITMSVTAPLAPAHAADVVHAIPAALPGVLTPVFHAHATGTDGKASTLAALPNITCYFQAYKPVVQGGRTDSSVYGGAGIICLYDIDGSAAIVSRIDLTASLSYGTQIVAIQNVPKSGDYYANVNFLVPPCRDGDWTSSASVRVDFPAGYSPPSDFASTADSTTLNFGDCPNDYVEVPDVIGLSLTSAQHELSVAGLTGVQGGDRQSCDVLKGGIAIQSPRAGSVVLLGSTVVLHRSSGRPPTCL